MGREPFSYKKRGHTMDEPSNIWEKIQSQDNRWQRKPDRRISFDWATVAVLLVMAAVVICLFAFAK